MKKISLLTLLVTISGIIAPLATHAANATELETTWFAGEWAVSLAPVEGYDTIVSRTYPNVRIEHRGGTRIARISTLPNNEQVTIEFDVRSFKGNFPWWSASGGGNLVAKRVDETTFDLAGVGPMGKADWAHAFRHTRVKTDVPETP